MRVRRRPDMAASLHDDQSCGVADTLPRFFRVTVRRPLEAAGLEWTRVGSPLGVGLALLAGLASACGGGAQDVSSSRSAQSGVTSSRAGVASVGATSMTDTRTNYDSYITAMSRLVGDKALLAFLQLSHTGAGTEAAGNTPAGLEQGAVVEEDFAKRLGGVEDALRAIKPPAGLIQAHQSLIHAWNTAQQTFHALATAMKTGSKSAAEASFAHAHIGRAASIWLPAVEAYARRHGYPPPVGFVLDGGYSPS